MTGWYSSSWKARSLEYGEGGGFPPPFSYATKQSGGDKTHRPPDTAARLRPTKQPVCFTTERAVCDTSVQKYCNPGVKIRGILFTRFNPRANISRQIKELAEQLSEYISAPIYKTYIRAAVAVEEAQANRSDIFNYAGKSTVADDYRAFIEEFLKGADA